MLPHAQLVLTDLDPLQRACRARPGGLSPARETAYEGNERRDAQRVLSQRGDRRVHCRFQYVLADAPSVRLQDAPTTSEGVCLNVFFFTLFLSAWRFWREGWIPNKTQKLGGTNTVIGISSALFSVQQFGIEVDFVPGPFPYY